MKITNNKKEIKIKIMMNFSKQKVNKILQKKVNLYNKFRFKN